MSGETSERTWREEEAERRYRGRLEHFVRAGMAISAATDLAAREAEIEEANRRTGR